jgi:hypothetical protein
MVDRRRLPTTRGQLPDPVPVDTDKDGKLTTQSVGALNAFMHTYASGFNGGISFGDGRSSSQAGNIDGQVIVLLTPAVADAEFSVPHGLDRVPIGYLVLGKNLAAHIYDSNRGGWGVRQIFLRCDQASVTVTLLLI